MKIVIPMFLLSLGGLCVLASQTVYRAELNGAQQVHELETDHSGFARVALSADGAMLNVIVFHTVNEATAAHIHLGAMGENGPVLFGLGAPTSPIIAAIPVTEEDVENLRAGNFYFNIHTEPNPAGEIRGQIVGGVPAALYRVTITNLTKNQIFSPPIVGSHDNTVSFAQMGGTASPGLQTLAEEGNPLELGFEGAASQGFLAGNIADGPVLPGQSVTLDLLVSQDFPYISAAGMLISTNDAFFLAGSVRAPVMRPFPPFKNGHNNGNGRTMVMALALDAGTEGNDENCDHIPGPPCGSSGATAGEGEGFIHVHNGIHGIGDLPSDQWDWRGPVARIVIQATEGLPLGDIPFKE